MVVEKRSFEIARKVVDATTEGGDIVKTPLEEPAYPEAKLPEYATIKSAGADFFCAEEVTIPSIWKAVFESIGNKAGNAVNQAADSVLGKLGYTRDREAKKVVEIEPTIVHTGIKASMYCDEVLEIYNRSSNPKKLGLILANSVGVVDADYYNCEDNDGEIMFAYYNIKPWDVTLKVGDKVGQGVFKKTLKPEIGLVIADRERKGGFGSTDKAE